MQSVRTSSHVSSLFTSKRAHIRAAIIAVFGVAGAACVGAPNDESFGAEAEAGDVVASQQALSKQALASTATATVTNVKAPPVGGGTVVVYFQCGWDPKSLSAQCSCHGDADCNRMFTSGFCGENASCDNGANTCTCDLKL
jgi:hypothetical protein